MTRTTVMALLLSASVLAAQTRPRNTIGAIDFYGYQGLDIGRIRTALPIHEGSEITPQTKQSIVESVTETAGWKPTDVATVCCDPKGRSLIYIGLRGETFKPFALNPAPAGKNKLPKEIVDLSDRIDDAILQAVVKGQAQEDDSQGYALVKDPAARALQLQEHAWAVAHGPELIQVLRNSADTRQREIASEVLGYAQQSHEQLAALIDASRDPDSNVRNNATRALGVLVMSNPKLASEIEPDTFLAMMASGIWTDRNKAVWLISAMTQNRDPQLLAKIRTQALGQLVEMAKWSATGHALGARLILGRIAGIPEDKLGTMLSSSPPDAIIQAATSH